MKTIALLVCGLLICFLVICITCWFAGATDERRKNDPPVFILW